jgi:capsular polysaccharide transport system permease protein
MYAVILRDLRTRFFNHGLGYLIAIAWPISHLFVLLFIYTIMGRTSPYGDTLYLFLATGLIPTLTFMYVSRLMAYSLNHNKPMLAFPAVLPTDILFGRAILEIVAAVMMTLVTGILLIILGDNPVPVDIPAAVEALTLVIILSIGMGMIVGVLSSIFPILLTAYILVVILFYICSGTLFVVSALPEQIAYALSWNPVLHGTEWIRTAYFIGYPDQILDKGYLAGWAVGTVFVGLVLERVLRPWVLEA